VLCAFLAYDLARSNVADEVTRSCPDAVPIASGPFDTAPTFEPEHRDLAKLTPGRTTANTFTYHFEQSRAEDESLAIAPDLSLEPRKPHLSVRGQGELTTHDGHLAVRLLGKRGDFTLYFFATSVYAGLALSLSAWVALATVVSMAAMRKSRPPDGLRLDTGADCGAVSEAY
jgi:hypothetical protein